MFTAVISARRSSAVVSHSTVRSCCTTSQLSTCSISSTSNGGSSRWSCSRLSDSWAHANVIWSRLSGSNAVVLVILFVCNWRMQCELFQSFHNNTGIAVGEYGLTSHQTHYWSYRGRFLRVRWPNQQCQALKDNSWSMVSPPGKGPISPDQAVYKVNWSKYNFFKHLHSTIKSEDTDQ